MVQLAVHDALNAIDRRFEPYLLEGRAAPQAAPGAAIAAAARDVLAGVIPAVRHARAARQGARAARGHLRGRAREGARRAVAPGSGSPPARPPPRPSSRRALRTARRPIAAYTPGAAPGQWRPTPNPVPANPPMPTPPWRRGTCPPCCPSGRPSLPSPWRRLAVPPARPARSSTSEAYARDYVEVQRLGGKASAPRTPEQTEIARYWYEGSPQGWSRIARVVSAQRGLDRWDNARLLALVNAAMADGFVAGADTRYLYNFWRPVTAIRAGDTDGNDAHRPRTRVGDVPEHAGPARLSLDAQRAGGGGCRPCWRGSSAPTRWPSP